MNEKDGTEEKLNLITLGNSAVGKTSYILKFTSNSFQQVYLTTVWIDFKSKIIIMPNKKKYNIVFYDTTGEERFRSISVNTVKNANGIVLMYDITKKKTFDDISVWMKSIKEIKDDNFPIILIGNKSDLEEQRQVKKEDGEEIAKKYNIDFYETSNKDGINIEESCMDLINKVIIYKDNLKKQNEIRNEGLSLSDKRINKDKKSSGCCK